MCFLWKERKEKKKEMTITNKLSIIRCYKPHQKEEDKMTLPKTRRKGGFAVRWDLTCHLKGYDAAHSLAHNKHTNNFLE